MFCIECRENSVRSVRYNWMPVPVYSHNEEKNLDVAVLYMLDLNIKDIIDEKKLIHPDSVLARNALIK